MTPMSGRQRTRRGWALAAAVLFGSSTAAVAQAIAGSSLGGDAALSYEWVHSNTQPGHCGCFDITGVGLSYSRNVTNRIAGVGDLSVVTAKNGPGTGNSLTLVSYLLGARYYAHQPWFQGPHAAQPFGQLLVGIAHAGGGIAGAGDNTYAMAARGGAGLDFPFGKLALRFPQVDYYYTNFANASTTQHQNNFFIGGGAVFRWTRMY